MTVALLPSAEVAFIGWATAHTALAAIHGGRVGTRLASVLPAIRVTRIGDAPPEPWRDAASLQVDCWAATQATADLLARTVIAALPDVRGLVVTLGRVYTYEVTSGPYWAPDDPSLSSNSRYILTVNLLTTSN